MGSSAVQNTFSTLPLHVSSIIDEMPTAAMEQINTEEDIKNKKAPAQPPKKKPAGGAHGKDGIFSPVVLAAKGVMGDDAQFNKLRAKVISMHSDVIKNFVDTSDTAFGQAVLKRLFEIADGDKSGTIEESELKKAFEAIGFDWLKDKQVRGIMSKFDANENGKLELEEWLIAAPKTLRTNLVKLAKKNGGDLGFLA